jgi:hypothetical protein
MFGYTYISSPVLCVLHLSTLSNILLNLSCLSETDWRSLIFWALSIVQIKNTTFRRPAPIRSSDTEAPNLVDPLKRVMLIRWVTFRKPTLLPSSARKTPSLVNSLDRAILIRWVPQKHSFCSDTRMRTDRVYG